VRGTVRLAFIFVLAVGLESCGRQDESSDRSSLDQNSSPVITGKPKIIARQGALYSFEPVASDVDGDVLNFSIAGRPPWADFDEGNGALSGRPGNNDLGTYAGIVISVSDGKALAVLPAFNIVVVAEEAASSITLSWTAPTQNADGTPLTDLAGFRIYYGKSADDYPYFDTINDPNANTHRVDNLVPGEWFFRVIAFDTSFHESRLSDAVSTIVE
jgi:hypothetical protein